MKHIINITNILLPLRTAVPYGDGRLADKRHIKICPNTKKVMESDNKVVYVDEDSSDDEILYGQKPEAVIHSKTDAHDAIETKTEHIKIKTEPIETEPEPEPEPELELELEPEPIETEPEMTTDAIETTDSIDINEAPETADTDAVTSDSANREISEENDQEGGGKRITDASKQQKEVDIGDSVSTSGESDDASSDSDSDSGSGVSIDTQAILNVDPLYFRLTKFLQCGAGSPDDPTQNVAQILTKINYNLEKMNSLFEKFVEK